MVGGFGEVYLLDWGVAVALDDRHEGRLPIAAQERRLAGTPRFMAPEMALADGARLSPRTDVYLLGATLYAVLTGRAPHRGDDLEKLLLGIGNFVPTFGEAVPEALAMVVAQAMALLPEEPFDADTWGNWTKAVKEATGRKGKGLFMPLRKALTGMERGPSVGDMLVLMGRARALQRLA